MLRHLAGEGFGGAGAVTWTQWLFSQVHGGAVSSVYLLLTRARARRVNEEGFRLCGVGVGGHPVIAGNSSKDSQGNRAACLVVC